MKIQFQSIFPTCVTFLCFSATYSFSDTFMGDFGVFSFMLGGFLLWFRRVIKELQLFCSRYPVAPKGGGVQ